LAQWFLRRSRLKEKVDAGRTDDGRRTTDGRTDAAPWHKLSWPSARWANKGCIFSTFLWCHNVKNYRCQRKQNL